MAASGGVARGRLAEERKSWRKSHPHGFVAKPETLPDGTVNLMVWKCVIPGKEGWFPGFVAKSVELPDAFDSLLLWNSVIAGKEGLRKKNIKPFIYAGTVTDWEGGYFPVALNFTENYPSNPPTCKFPAKFFHVNVYDCGEVCLSILGGAWKPSITVRQILIGIQDLLDNPNPASAAQDLAYNLFTKNMPEYRNRVRQQAKLYPSLV